MINLQTKTRPSLPELQVGENYFIPLWVGLKQILKWRNLFFRGTSKSGFFLHQRVLWHRSRGVQAIRPIDAYANPPFNTWYHLAATFEPVSQLASIFINGKLEGSTLLPKGFDSSFYTQQAIPLDDLDLTNGKPAGVSHLTCRNN